MNAEPFGTDLEQKELKNEGWRSVQRARLLNMNYGLGGGNAERPSQVFPFRYLFLYLHKGRCWTVFEVASKC